MDSWQLAYEDGIYFLRSHYVQLTSEKVIGYLHSRSLMKIYTGLASATVLMVSFREVISFHS
jgi:hypothetical protein